jgi:hypothetical protein
MRRAGFGASEIHAALEVANRERCSPPLPSFEVRKIAESVSRYEPDQALVAVVGGHYETDRLPIEAEASLEDVPREKRDNPGPLPVELLRCPGFISELMDYTLSTAPYPNQALAFAGALALQALLAGRKVRDAANNRTNLYLLALAHSASGKLLCATWILDPVDVFAL